MGRACREASVAGRVAGAHLVRHPIRRAIAPRTKVTFQDIAFHSPKTIEHDGCKWGNGDRAISPQRESRRIPTATPASGASLVPFDGNLSADLRYNLRISLRNLCLARLVGGEGGIRTPETLSSLHAFQACALNRARPPLRSMHLNLHVDGAGFTSRAPRR
jgi:hypothetical protein